MQWRPCLCNLKLFVYFVYEVFVLMLQFSLWDFFGEGCGLEKEFFVCYPKKMGTRFSCAVMG